MIEDNKNMNKEDLAKKLDAMDRGVNTNAHESVSNEADAMESIVDAQGLGRVDMSNFGPATPERSDNILGWHDVNLADLPSKGKFYPAD